MPVDVVVTFARTTLNVTGSVTVIFMSYVATLGCEAPKTGSANVASTAVTKKKKMLRIVPIMCLLEQNKCPLRRVSLRGAPNI
jgi:hypothetical protein